MAALKTWTYRAIIVVGLTTILLVSYRKKTPLSFTGSKTAAGGKNTKDVGVVDPRLRVPPLEGLNASWTRDILERIQQSMDQEAGLDDPLLNGIQMSPLGLTLGLSQGVHMQGGIRVDDELVGASRSHRRRKNSEKHRAKKDKKNQLHVHKDPKKRNNTPPDEGNSLEVPHIIHQQWDSNMIPRKFARYVKSWARRHPLWQYVFWTPWDVQNFLQVYYPEDGLRQYHAEATLLMKDDIMRFYVMDHFGGVYADLDMECLHPLDDFVRENRCFITENAHEHSIILDKKERPTMLITIAGCRRRHPFFHLAQHKLDSYQDLTFGQKHFFTDMVFVEYNKNREKQSREDRIGAAEPGIFLPLIDPAQMSWIRKFCREELDQTPLQEETCAELADRNYRNERRNYSLAVHYWEHFVFWDQARKHEDEVSIFEVIPRAKNATRFMLEYAQNQGSSG